MKKKILVTGSAGFIGYHLCDLLLELNYEVIGVDALTDYYDQRLKNDRLKFWKKNQILSTTNKGSKILIHLPKSSVHIPPILSCILPLRLVFGIRLNSHLNMCKLTWLDHLTF